MKSTILSTLLMLLVGTLKNMAQAKESVSLMRRALQSTTDTFWCGVGEETPVAGVRNREIKMDTFCCCTSIVVVVAATAVVAVLGEGSAVGLTSGARTQKLVFLLLLITFSRTFGTCHDFMDVGIDICFRI
jgi:hypothetical protein